jgi:hypothetical protein
MAAGSHELIEHLIHAEATGFLTRWELFKRLEKLPDDHLGRHKRPEILAPPAKIHVRLVGETLEWVLSQVDDLRHVQRLESRLGEIALHHLEVNFLVVHSQSIQTGVIVEVKDLAARAFSHLAFEERQEVVAVEMILERLVTNFHSLLELFPSDGIAGSSEKFR